MTTPAPSGLAPSGNAAISHEGMLAGLRDIELPAAVPFWPPAPGWIALAGLAVLVLLVLAIREWRFRQTLAYQALREFDAKARTARPGDAQALAAAASGVMRRLAQAADGAAAVRTGTQWADFLCSGKAAFDTKTAAFLAGAPYWPPGEGASAPVDALRLAAAVRRWIRARA